MLRVIIANMFLATITNEFPLIIPNELFETTKGVYTKIKNS